MTRSDALQYLLKQRLIDIQITLNENDANGHARGLKEVYHPGDLLDGYFEIISTVELEISNIQILFEGTIRTWSILDAADELSTRSSSQAYTFLHQTQQLSRHSYRSERSENGGQVFKIGFNFIIPKTLIPQDTISEQHLQLPPSFKAGESIIDRIGRAYMQPLISYNIRATAELKNNSAGNMNLQKILEVKLIPFTEISPPLAVEDFPQEYTFNLTRSLTKIPFGGKCGDLWISMNEPPALRFTDRSTNANTTNQLKLMLTGGSGLITDKGAKHLTCVIRSGILVKIFSSTTSLSGMPSYSMIKTKQGIQAQLSYIELPTRKLNVQLNETDDQDKQFPRWATSITLPIECPRTLVPTFCCRLAAVRYAFKIHIDIKGMYHLPMSLEVPIQVLYHGETEADRGLTDSTRHGNEMVDAGAVPETEMFGGNGALHPPEYDYY